MPIHQVRLVGSCALLLLAAPSAGAGQETPARFSVIPVAGVAPGPAPSLAFGLEIEAPVTPALSLQVEYARRTSSLAACTDSWPQSYQCSLRGQSLLAGVRLQHTLSDAGLAPYAALSGGAVRRHRNALDEHVAPAVAFGAGIRMPVWRDWAIQVGGQRTWVIDEDYESLMGEDLRYTTVKWATELPQTR